MRPLHRTLLFALVLGLSACKTPPADVVLPADCPVLAAPGRLPETPEAAAALRQKGTSWSNRDIRARYVCAAEGIGPLNEQWKAQGLTTEERAKRAYQVRHDARRTARAMMASAAEVEALRQRDRDKYGDPDGPTFEWLVKNAEKKGLSGDAVLEEIIKSAQRTDAAVNRSLGL
jgi:hypothetical protein